jgi:MFS superfamily sulfate permease-like transporter
MEKHHRHEHHEYHEHQKKDEPKSKLRKLAAPITLIVILLYATQWAVRYPRVNLAAGIAIAATAAALWILYPRKGR